jgi:electron transfer flavoprotein alpha/beta subunit
MAAKKKPVEQVSADTAATADGIRWSEPFVPERTVTGTVLQDVPVTEAAAQLVTWLREQKVLS